MNFMRTEPPAYVYLLYGIIWIAKHVKMGNHCLSKEVDGWLGGDGYADSTKIILGYKEVE
jgi:hypothetical protein